MFTFYWLFQKGDDWLAIFKTGEVYQQANDRESLRQALSNVHYLVGYENYRSSDRFLAKILTDGKSSFLQEFLSLDLSQEAKKRSIEEIGFFTGLSIAASTPEEFCKRRIAIVERIFDEREEYLETKFEIVKEFKLPARSVTKTRAGLAAEILGAKKKPKRPNVLIYDYDKRLPLSELPERLVGFYNKIKKSYQNTQEENLADEKFKMTLADLTHTYGFGGVHAAREKYKGEGTYLMIDVNQFFPALIVNNSLISSAAKRPQAFQGMYEKKVETGKKTYKTLINATNGAMKNPYSPLYDPHKYYSVTVNGQLIITHLLLILLGFIQELIQTNTDGLLVKVDPRLVPGIKDIVRRWCDHFNLQVSISEYRRVWQRDVNNYILQRPDGSFVRKGVYASPTYESNNLPVVTEGSFEVLTQGIKPQAAVVRRFKKNQLDPFYYVGKLQGNFERIEHRRFDRYQRLNNTVCGIATTNPKMGGVFQVKNDLHSKLPGSPQHFLPINEATMKSIDTSWYVDQIEKNIF